MEENKNVEVIEMDDLIVKNKKKYGVRALFNYLNKIKKGDVRIWDLGEMLDDYTNNYNKFMRYLDEHQNEWNNDLVIFEDCLIGRREEYGEEGPSILENAQMEMLAEHIYDRLSTLYVGEAIDLDEVCKAWCKDKKYKFKKEDILKVYDYDGVVEHPQFIRVIETNQGTTLFYSVYNADDNRFERLWEYVEKLRRHDPKYDMFFK